MKNGLEIYQFLIKGLTDTEIEALRTAQRLLIYDQSPEAFELVRSLDIFNKLLRKLDDLNSTYKLNLDKKDLLEMFQNI